MAEQKSRPVEAATAAPGEKRSASRAAPLARSSESGLPDVHKVMADLDAVRKYGPPEREAELVAELAELGFSG